MNANKQDAGGLPNELGFEQWYVTNTFDYPSNPLGSRDCSIARNAWHAALEAVRNGEQRRGAVGLPEFPFSPYIVSEWTGPEMTSRKTWTAYSEEQMRAYGEQCRAASGELEELREWKAEHQAFLVRLSVALVVDGGCKQDQIEACVDELIAERDNLRALSRGVPEGKCQHAWQPDPDVMNARYCPKCDVTQTIAAQRKEG